MKLKEKLAQQAVHDLHVSAFAISADVLIRLERKAFVLGFEKARELAEQNLMQQLKPRVEDIHVIRQIGEEEV